MNLESLPRVRISESEVFAKKCLIGAQGRVWRGGQVPRRITHFRVSAASGSLYNYIRIYRLVSAFRFVDLKRSTIEANQSIIIDIICYLGH